MSKIMNLNKTFSIILKPIAPYNFDLTVHNPSHFPTPIEVWKPDEFWKTMRFRNIILGTRLENKGTIYKPKIKLTVYSNSRLSKKFIQDLIKDLNFRYGFTEDISEFYKRFKSDLLLGPVLKRMRGARGRCLESLYELIMISIVLQNATVRRTVQMMNALLKKYGQRIRFDNEKMYLIWKPQKLAKVSEQELRDLKVGYRAKMFIKISKHFAAGKIDEYKLREISLEQVKKELLGLYGVGPATLDILIWEVLRKPQLKAIQPWEQKIYSRLLFNKKLVLIDKILKELKRRYGKWFVSASHLLFTNLFWRHKKKKIDWLEKEIRL